MNAYLLLANGMVFAGQSVGAEGVTVGEVVFPPAWWAFQETLDRPQLLWPDHHPDLPLIGNYGMNKDDMESDRIWAKGYIVREACTTLQLALRGNPGQLLKKNNTIGIEGHRHPPPDPHHPGERCDERCHPDHLRPRRPGQQGRDRGSVGSRSAPMPSPMR